MDSKLIEILIQAKDDASAALMRVGGAVDNLDEKQRGMVNNVAKGTAIVTAFGGIALAGVAAYGLYASGAFQQTSISMQNLIGNTQLANQVFGQLAVYANNTPFTFSDVSKAAQTLLGFGYGGQQSVNMIKQMGDVAAASGGKIGDLALVTGQIFSQGKLRAQDLYQVINDGGAGVVKIMAQNAGGMQNLTDEFNKGGIPAKQYFDAINQATAKGGFAFQGAINQSATFAGRISTLQDAFTQLAMRIGGVQVTSQGLVIDPNGLFSKATNAVLGLINTLNGLPDWWTKNKGTIQLIAGGITGALTGLAVAWVIVNKAQIAAAISAGLALLPYILIGAAVAMLAVLIVQHWGQITAFITNSVSMITNVVGAGLNWLKDNWLSTIGFIVGFVATLPLKLPTLMWDALTGMAALVGRINWGSVFSVIGNALAAVFNTEKNLAVDTFNFLRGINWGGIAISIVKGEANAVVDLLQGAVNGALAGIPGSPKIHLPHFAQGGWVPGAPGQAQLAVVHGGEYVLSQQMLAGQQAAAVGGGAGDLHVHLHLNGVPGDARTFAETVYRQLMRIDRANGTPQLPNIGVRP